MIRISYKNFPLFEGRENGPQRMSLKINNVVQQESVVRGENQAVFGRGNKSTSVQFSLEKEFSDVAEAMDFYLLHAEELPENSSGDLVFQIEPGKSLVLEDACLMGVDMAEPVGVSVTVNYSFVGRRVRK